MDITFGPRAIEHLHHWITTDPKVARKILELLDDARRSPFRGLGKPEPLKGDLKGWWSRRIDDEHRLVYRLVGKDDDQRLEVSQCRWHY
jgi:toxin YoeB